MLVELVKSLCAQHNTKGVEVTLSSAIEIPMFVKMCDDEGIIWGGSRSKVSQKSYLIEEIVSKIIVKYVLNLYIEGDSVFLYINSSYACTPKIYFKAILSPPKCLRRL